MMAFVQCPNCGLKNKATHANCVRCYASLQEAAGAFSLAEPPASKLQVSTLIKLIVGGAFLLCLILIGGILAYYFSGRINAAKRNASFEAAVRSARDFNLPVAVQAGRYSFFNQDANRFDQEATPAAYRLDRLGLLYIHTGFFSDTSPTVDSQGRTIIDPQTGLVPFEYRHVDLQLTQSGQAQSAGWEPYEDKKDGKVGWTIPIGERQLVRVVEVMPIPEGQPLTDAATVSFTWKWRPNEIGQSFDKRSASYFMPNGPKNFPRSSWDVEVNDSQANYWGTADLHRVNDGWEAARFIWIGPGGVTLSPNASAEVDKMVKESQNR